MMYAERDGMRYSSPISGNEHDITPIEGGGNHAMEDDQSDPLQSREECSLRRRHRLSGNSLDGHIHDISAVVQKEGRLLPNWDPGFEDTQQDFSGEEKQAHSKRLSVKDDAMTSRSDDGKYNFGGRSNRHRNQLEHEANSDENDDEVERENQDYVDDRPLSTRPSVMYDHTPTSMSKGLVNMFHRLHSNRDSQYEYE